MATKNRYFEVIVNGNFFNPAYTLEVKNEKSALSKATKEAKNNRNSTIDIIEVDAKGDMLENGFSSGTIKL